MRYKVINTAKEDPYIIIGNSSYNDGFWKFGYDNLFPQAVAFLNRSASVHRGILRSKTRYIAGNGFTTTDRRLEPWLQNSNAYGESLKDITRKLVYDFVSFGNAYLEIVTNPKKRFLNLYHQDATKCRLSYDKKRIILNHNWKSHNKTSDKSMPIYPVFEDTLNDGNLRSVIHFKQYEPEYENYGIMDWVAGLNVSSIAYKTDKWNISRLDNSFNTSGVMIVASEFKSDEDAKEFNEAFDEKFIGEGKQGQILLITQEPGQTPDTSSRYIPVNQAAEGDWKELHLQSTSDLVIAHGWFRSLSGIADNTGFDTNRILNEYEVALRTVINDTQEVFLGWFQSIISEILGYDTLDLSFINTPPFKDKPPYMKIWEARKIDGFEYDENDPEQQKYLASISSKNGSDNGK